MEFKTGDRVIFKRNNIKATVVETKTKGQPYKLKFKDGGCIWVSANAIESVRCKHERRERLPILIRVDIGHINIPSIIDGPCSTYKLPYDFPSTIGGKWDFNIPSVIVLDGLNIPSVITLSGIGD